MNILERREVAKAGGWSVASNARSRLVMTYIQSNQEIYYLIVSAAGAVNEGDLKDTDLFIACSPEPRPDHPYYKVYHEVYPRYGSKEAVFEDICRRSTSLGRSLGYYDFPTYLNQIAPLIEAAARVDSEAERERFRNLIVSRGEWLNGHMWADILGWRFIDPTELIRFRKDGRFDERSYRLIASRLRGEDRFVIPGF